MTNQEIFDHVLNKIRGQGGFSWSEVEGQCMYRGEGGCKCAVGWLIPDDMYSEGFEGRGMAGNMANNSLPFKEALCAGCGREEDDLPVDLLCRLQSAHDRASCRSNGRFTNDARMIFEGNMEWVARRFGLRYEVA